MESASAVGKARRIGVSIVSGLVLLASCASERPSAAELADSLITVTDLEGEWTIDSGPDDDAAVSSSGVVTDEQRELLPRPDLCPDASTEARGVVDGLEWQAFRQLNETVDDPIDPPLDREGRIVFVQEFLLAADPNDLDADFDLLRAGHDACVGDIPAGEEGPGTMSEVDLGPVGDESMAYLYEIGEAGGSGTWYVYSVFARVDDVLLSLTVADVVMGDLQPEVDLALVDELTEKAMAKL